MSLLNTLTDEEKNLLVMHGLNASDNSQLSDSFIIGLRYGRKSVDIEMYEMLKECEILLTEGTQEHCEVLAISAKDLLAKVRSET